MGLRDGEEPFPWQRELLRRFLGGTIERSLDIPTGLGKTGVMAIWLVARACGAPLPRRLVYVVDRRAVVDQATEVAERLRSFAEREPGLKAALGLGTRSLPISTLRGQHVDNKEWLEDPASPAIIVGTVDMIGSKLLFEGYGVSRKMRPYHAGLLGADTLVVLDEAHLVPPFERLLETIADGGAVFGLRDPAVPALVPPFHLLALSATGRSNGARSFGLTDDDLKPGTVPRKRLDAKKRLRFLPLPADTDLGDALARQAWSLAGEGKRAIRCVVYSHRRKVAEAAKKALEALAKGDKKKGLPEVPLHAELLVGGRRVFERVGAAQRLKELGFLAGSGVALDRSAFLFATSAGEVGVDLDADHMVSDLVAWERMVQRLGRVNRRGAGDAQVVVLVDSSPDAKVKEALDKDESSRTAREAKLVKDYEESQASNRTWRAPFDHLPPFDDGTVDVSPGALRVLRLRAREDSTLQELLDAATTPSPLRPALTRALVDAWSMTSLKEHTGRPKIAPWLRGWEDDSRPQPGVVWRTHLPVRAGRPVSKREVEAFFEAAPPHASEVLETESYRVTEWLGARAEALAAMAKGGGESDSESSRDPVAIALTPTGEVARLFRLGDLLLKEGDQKAREKKKEDLEEILPGATLVVSARLGGLGLGTGLLDQGEDAAPKTADDGTPWLSAGSSDDEGEAPVTGFRVRVVDANVAPAADARWRERHRLAHELTDEGEPRRWIVVEKWRADAATEEDRSTGRPQTLRDHQSLTERRARELATRLALPAAYRDALAVAALLHDAGKDTRRWQLAANAEPSGGPYAKTRGPMGPALLDGYRHEFGALPVAESDGRMGALPEDLRDLALHLIAAHHGFARPIIESRGCEDAPPSALESRQCAVTQRFARLQRRWGPWGLAWWEALLRAADQQASRDNDEAESREGT